MIVRSACALLGLVVAVVSTGCCCGGGYGCNRCAAPSPCATGGCSPSYYQPSGMYQGAYSPEMTGANVAAVTDPNAGYPMTAMAPTQLLPN